MTKEPKNTQGAALREIVGTLLSSLPHENYPDGERVEYLSAAGNLAPYLITGMVQRGEKLVVVVADQQCADALAMDLREMGTGDGINVFPSVLGQLYDDSPPDSNILTARLETVWRLSQDSLPVVITTLQALWEPTVDLEDLSLAGITVRKGGVLDLDDLCQRLVKLGYTRESLVARRGQFSRRGGILDVYPTHLSDPLRLELFGDEVDRLQWFDTNTQRAVGDVDQAEIIPAREVLWETVDRQIVADSLRQLLEETSASLASAGQRRALDLLQEGVANDITCVENGVAFDRLELYLPLLNRGRRFVDGLTDRRFLFVDPVRIVASQTQMSEESADVLRHRALRGEILPLDRLWSTTPEAVPAPDRSAGLLNTLGKQVRWTAWSSIQSHADLLPSVRVEEWVSSAPGAYRGQIQALVSTLCNWMDAGMTVVMATEQPTRLREILDDNDITDAGLDNIGPGRCAIGRARISAGFVAPGWKLALLTDTELFGASRHRVSRRRIHEGIPIASVMDLRPGEPVVHIQHGIGIYRGIGNREVLGVRRDYIIIEYAPPDQLLVPCDQIDRIQKYVGSEDEPPEIRRLGGTEWARAKKQARARAQKVAAELVKLYAAREAAERPPYGEDSPWQQELESSFPFEETPDQLQAIREVKRDMENTRRPMDRLICGDVGFGKTEVAIRAIFKAVEDGRQVAVLCPTTVLAAQHYATLSERFAPYPISIALLSRFSSPKEARDAVERFKVGALDVLVGTHRLLSADVKPQNLGLIVVDEEQRFGVRHKERLKELRASVDVMTLTATPIPRTLHMAMGGLRSMSVINDPPFGRLPVRTIVRSFDEEVVREAIVRELSRGGQVFYVHNRVQSIYHVAEKIKKLVPWARVRVGHGQMPDAELEEVMMDLYEHRFDVLVCTTIVENGLDVPNANTLIVERANTLGLAQLYQLRGRVGRSDRQAYAYFFYSHEKRLDSRAHSRLAAMREFSGLGSGLKIAMRDLEIRGAGNLLGVEQHGAMLSVGLELYTQMLAEEIRNVRGETEEVITLPPVELPINAYIPESFVAEENERFYFYKRMAACRSYDDIKAIEQELRDRYGPCPQTVTNAIRILQLRIAAWHAGVQAVKSAGTGAIIQFPPGVRLDNRRIAALNHAYRQHRFAAEQMQVGLTGYNSIIDAVADGLDIAARALRG